MNKIIYCQRDIPKNELRYGFRTSAATGCGWISVYNALCILGYNPKPDTVKRYFEKQIPLLNGNAGTFILSPAMFFKRFGFRVKVTVNRKEFDAAASDADVCILYFWWKKHAIIGAHFVALHKTEKGFVGYNTYTNSKGPDLYGESIDKFIKSKKYFGAVLISVKDRKI